MSKDVSSLADHRSDGEAFEADSTVSELVKVLSKALRGLGNDGHAETASQLAAQAWVLTRYADPVAAERLSGLLHYLARLDPTPVDHHPPTSPPVDREEQS